MTPTRKRQSKQHAEFQRLTDRLLAVPRAVVERRIAEHRERVANTPNNMKPGRNRKITDRAADDREGE
jgi:hypothetical protein